ncbi:hypothetical protein BDZ94DRAFT_1253922 [Collybia nuda]|uniref:Uncharacterized protein n=1 Tax=Collybia nuda TaxID=64659 RepID=A0A9P5YD46_9AGAR|nr:hypothetical protein BDZ94DRAFT_1253922 [Collybia nuda]
MAYFEEYRLSSNLNLITADPFPQYVSDKRGGGLVVMEWGVWDYLVIGSSPLGIFNFYIIRVSNT